MPISDDAPDFPALRIAVKALGGDAESRVWQRLRERDGLAYSAGVSLAGASFEARSALRVYASAASEHAAAASLQQELARALAEEFSAGGRACKSAWLPERQTALRDDAAHAAALATNGLYNGRDYAWLERYDEKISSPDERRGDAGAAPLPRRTPIVWATGRGEPCPAQTTKQQPFCARLRSLPPLRWNDRGASADQASRPFW